ncbi:hypothetical protein BHM03_00057454 [Ensete ventricosum]|nr:hypothetical protein BHM03_00057454 [Ensete ventricosum]
MATRLRGNDKEIEGQRWVATTRAKAGEVLGNLSGCITCTVEIKTKIDFPRRSNRGAKDWGRSYIPVFQIWMEKMKEVKHPPL